MKNRYYKRGLFGKRIPTRTTGPVQEEQQARREEKKQAVANLNELKDKIVLERPIFFVPGWTGEEGKAWLKPYPKRKQYHISIKEYIEKTSQRKKVHCLSFSTKESEQCNSFLDFADIVKEKVWDRIGTKESFDIVGHSMGGLDIIAALVQDKNYLKEVHNCVTVASPLRGISIADFLPKLKEMLPFMKKLASHHKKQCVNLDSDYGPIQYINKLEIRKRLLRRVFKFNQIYGSQDKTVMGSARLDKKGLLNKLCINKIETVKIGGASHSGDTGITQDPRTILAILSIITNIPIKKSACNYGIIRKNA